MALGPRREEDARRVLDARIDETHAKIDDTRRALAAKVDETRRTIGDKIEGARRDADIKVDSVRRDLRTVVRWSVTSFIAVLGASAGLATLLLAHR